MNNPFIAPVRTLAAWFLILAISGCATIGETGSNHAAAGSVPNPLHAQTRFALEGIDLSFLTIDGMAEKEFVATKQGPQVASWEGDKAAIRENFEKAVRETAGRLGLTIADATGESAFIVRPVAISIANGSYRPFVVIKSRMKLKIAIIERSGKPVEDFVLEDAVAFDLIGPQASSGGRLRMIASDLGHEAMIRLEKLTKR